jgi:hypothetical protein
VHFPNRGLTSPRPASDRLAALPRPFRVIIELFAIKRPVVLRRADRRPCEAGPFRRRSRQVSACAQPADTAARFAVPAGCPSAWARSSRLAEWQDQHRQNDAHKGERRNVANQVPPVLRTA